MSVSFDRAASYYDATRSLPDEQMALLVSRILEALPGDGPCLEIGVGTGRIALPLIDRGLDVVGVDISTEMLRRLVTKNPATKVAIADATSLPFPEATFTSAIAAHVLHLVSRWTVALDELQRVLKPGGVFLASRAGGQRSPWLEAVRRHFYLEAGDPPWPPGIDTIEQLDDAMRARGTAVREIQDVASEGSSTINRLIAALEAGVWSACWSIDETVRKRAAVATRKWAGSEFGDLDALRPVSYHSDWRAYVLP